MYKKSIILKKIRQEMDKGTQLNLSISRSGVKNVTTVFYWRKARPLIDRYILKCMFNNRDKRDDTVEDAWFKKLIEGRGSAADYINWLSNRRPNDWKKVNSDLLHKGGAEAGGTTVNVNVFPNKVAIFRDLKNDRDSRTADSHAGEGAESNRIQGQI